MTNSSSKVHQALKAFRGKEKLNCAEAVGKTFFSSSEEFRKHQPTLKSSGGGRAPMGTCGALWAAFLVSPHKQDKLKKAFIHRWGTTRCKDLKRNKVSCQDCVAYCASLLSQQ